MVYAVFACPEPAPDGRRRARGRAARRAPARAGRAGASWPARRASATAIRPGSSRATSRSSATASGRASAPGCSRSSSSRATSGELERVPELRFVDERRRCPHERRQRQLPPSRSSTSALSGERITDDDASSCSKPATSCRDRPRGGRAPQPQGRPGPGDVHHRPQRQLHEHLPHGLRLLRLLPAPGRHARGLPPAEAGHLQEDRGDARARRHGAAHAGRPPPRPRHRLLRGSLPLDQGALPDPPARALAARDAAHRPPLEADDPADADAPARRGARLAARRRRPRSSSTACATSSRRRRRSRPSGSASCATRTASGSRRPRR